MRRPQPQKQPLRFSQNNHHHHHRTAGNNHIECLPDDLVIFVLSKLSSTASSISDFINVLLTCKRLNRLGLHRIVLSKLCAKAFALNPKNWSGYAHSFLSHCVSAGNVEACYTLGMIRFYCLQNRRSGLSLMAKAAIKSHAPALYSLAVIQFNGSGGSKDDKDLRAGVALCARASQLGHVDALRELGHCLLDGYGAHRNVAEGRRLLLQANAREFALVVHAFKQSMPSSLVMWKGRRLRSLMESFIPLLGSDNCMAQPPVNRFMREWFESGRGSLDEGLRLCSHIGCGRVETRANEFRRCSICGKVNYCSRGCQALDWKMRHRMECFPVVEPWVAGNGGGGVAVVGGGNGDVVA